MTPAPNGKMRARRAVVAGALLATAVAVADAQTDSLRPAPAGDPTAGVLAAVDSLLTAGDAPAAAALAARALAAADPGAVHRWQLEQRRCVALVEAGEPGAALPSCEQAVLLAMDDPGNHVNLATCLQQLGQWGRAAGELAQALELAPGRCDWRLQYAGVLLRLGVVRESGRQIDLAAAACPDDPHVDRARADHALRRGDPAAAVAPLARLARTHPEDGSWRERLASACWQADRPADVDSVLAPVSVDSLSATELRLLLQAWRALGRGGAAPRLAPGGADADRAPQALRADPTYWALVSEVCLLAADPEAALAAIDQAVALAPGDPRWHQNRAAILVRLDREDEARAALGRARDLGGGTAP